MKKLFLSFVLVLLAVAAASAGVVTMQFNGTPTGNSYQGTPSYPSDVSVNGGPNQWMMCISYYEHISGGETWKADTFSISTLDPVTYLSYYEAAYLFTTQLSGGNLATGEVNAAIWNIMEGVPALDPAAAYYVTLAQSQTYSLGQFKGVTLFEAIPGTESGSLGTAQDFLATPEPGTLLTLGTGIIGLAGLVRKRSSR